MVEKEESPNDIARALLGRIEELYSRCEKDEHGNVSFWVDESPVEDPGLTYEYNNRLNKERSRLTPEETCEIRKGLIAAGALPKGSRILQLELKIRQT
ncbi:MAG: hypothetical protein U9Q67_04180, partial [Patescibacteria group bacterium]|nr:hypothetical protein [Patescibacteria group bacterium]